MKTCTKCGVEKEESEFSNHKGKKRAKCRLCCNTETKEWRTKNIEYVKIYSSKYTIKHKENIRLSQKKYRNNNTEKRKLLWRNWYLNNRNKQIEKATKIAKENPEISKKYNLISYLRHKDKRIQYNKEYELKNKDVISYKKTYLYYKNKLVSDIGCEPPKELIELKLLINKTKQLCKTLNS